MYNRQISIIFVYKYYIQINSHSYVGSSNQITRRLREHKKKLTHNYHDNKFMQRAYNKYKDGGKIYYQILEICSQDELKNREKYNLFVQ